MTQETQNQNNLTGNTQSGPEIIDVNQDFNLIKPVIIPFFLNQPPTSTVRVFKLIKRPVMNRIILVTQEFNRQIIYDGQTDFEAHKNDTLEQFVAVLLTKIDKEYSHSS